MSAPVSLAWALLLGAVASLAGSTLAVLPRAGGLRDALAFSVYLSVLLVPASIAGSLLLGRVLRPPRGRLALLGGLLGAILAPAFVEFVRGNHRRPLAFAPNAPSPAPHSPVVLIGLDGADETLLRLGIEAGELPTFERLIRSGTSGPLHTLVPTESPALWTSIATGHPPEAHGVTEYALTRFEGVATPFGISRPPRLIGWRWLRSLASRAGLARADLVSSRQRRVPTIWGLASAAGEQVAVVHWWASWPAEPVNGWLVTDRLAYHRSLALDRISPAERGLTHPPALASSLAPLVRDPATLSASVLAERSGLPEEEAERLFRVPADPPGKADPARTELPFLAALDETYGAVALRAQEDLPRLDLLAVYFRGIDVAQHAALDCDPRIVPEVSPERARLFGGIVRGTYRWTDRWLGRLLERLPPETLVLIVSDHGMRRALDEAGRVRFHHDDAPPGILIAWGPGVPRGARSEGAGLLDVAPTLLSALGLPVPREMPGRVLQELLGRQALLPRVPTWAPPGPGSAVTADGPEAGEEAERRLRALGYLR
ncbi:MAG: alkaline phosphatase family protein [Planctomycetes bacterium]|nr:alkaline phosphatase family protein [Planctomycetota bacterium]